MAEGEIRNWCVELLIARRAIVKERILKAIRLPKSPVLPRGPGDVVEASPLVRSIKDCLPDMNVFSPLSIEQKAENLLAKFTKLRTEKGKLVRAN